MSAEGLPGLRQGREGKREGLKVGTILSKIVPEVARRSAYPVACLSARDLSQLFEKIVPDFLARAGSAEVPTMKFYRSRQHPCRGLRIYIRKIVRTDRRGSTGIPGTRPPYQISRRGGGARLGAGLPTLWPVRHRPRGGERPVLRGARLRGRRAPTPFFSWK